MKTNGLKRMVLTMMNKAFLNCCIIENQFLISKITEIFFTEKIEIVDTISNLGTDIEILVLRLYYDKDYFDIKFNLMLKEDKKIITKIYF